MKLRAIEKLKNGVRHQYWLADLGLVGGKRIRKQFTSKGAAQTFLRSKRTEKSDGGSALLGFSDDDRLQYAALTEKLARLGATLGQAVEFFLEHQPKTMRTIAEAVAECVLAKRTNARRKRYVDALESYLNQFASKQGPVMVHAVTTAAIESWFAERGESMLNGGKLKMLSMLFEFCQKRGYCRSNPCDPVERPRATRCCPSVLTAAESKRLLDTCRSQKFSRLLGYVTLCLFAGVRPEECEKLDWSAVDLANKRVVIGSEVAKTNRRRITDLSDNAVAWLSLVPNRTGPVCPIPTWGRLRWVRRLRRVAGIKWGQDILRHTAASNMMARDQDAARVADQLGNSPQILLTHYRAVVTPEESAAFWSLIPGAS